MAEILAQDLGQYTEIVFCGYGEPTCRADDLFWLCDQLRAAGRADLPPIRLNTNGHGSLINHRDITPELKGRLDAVLPQRVEPGGVSPPHPSRRRGEGLAGHAGFCPPGGPVRAQGDGLHRGL